MMGYKELWSKRADSWARAWVRAPAMYPRCPKKPLKQDQEEDDEGAVWQPNHGVAPQAASYGLAKVSRTWAYPLFRHGPHKHVVDDVHGRSHFQNLLTVQRVLFARQSNQTNPQNPHTVERYGSSIGGGLGTPMILRSRVMSHKFTWDPRFTEEGLGFLGWGFPSLGLWFSLSCSTSPAKPKAPCKTRLQTP